MSTHIKVVAWLHLVFSSLALLIILTLLLSGGWLLHWLQAQVPTSQDAAQAVAFFRALSVVGTAVLCLGAVAGAVEFLASLALLKQRPWARIAILVFSILGIFGFPIGTGISIYSLWVLFHRETATLFTA